MKTIKVLETAKEIVEIGSAEVLNVVLHVSDDRVTINEEEYEASEKITPLDFVNELARADCTDIFVSIVKSNAFVSGVAPGGVAPRVKFTERCG